MNVTDEERRAAIRKYHKEWRAKNKDKVRESNRRYWEKRAAKFKEELIGRSSNTSASIFARSEDCNLPSGLLILK